MFERAESDSAPGMTSSFSFVPQTHPTVLLRRQQITGPPTSSLYQCRHQPVQLQQALAPIIAQLQVPALLAASSDVPTCRERLGTGRLPLSSSSCRFLLCWLTHRMFERGESDSAPGMTSSFSFVPQTHPTVLLRRQQITGPPTSSLYQCRHQPVQLQQALAPIIAQLQVPALLAASSDVPTCRERLGTGRLPLSSSSCRFLLCWLPHRMFQRAESDSAPGMTSSFSFVPQTHPTVPAAPPANYGTTDVIIVSMPSSTSSTTTGACPYHRPVAGSCSAGCLIGCSNMPKATRHRALAPIIAQLQVPALLAASSDVPTCRERLGTGYDTVLLIRAANASGCPAAPPANYGTTDVVIVLLPSSTSSTTTAINCQQPPVKLCGLCGWVIARSTNPFVFAMQALAPIIVQLQVPALLAASSDVPTCRERLGTGYDTVLLMRAANASGCPAAPPANYGTTDVVIALAPIIAQLQVSALLAASSDVPTCRERLGTGYDTVLLIRAANASGCPAAPPANYGTTDVVIVLLPSSTSSTTTAINCQQPPVKLCGLCGWVIARSTNPFVFAMQALAPIIVQLQVPALLADSSDVPTCRG
ncbi:hypothetical protein MRX96_000547 [Rhipicephalus microplus]